MSSNTDIDLDKLQFWAWLEMGINKGWVTEPFCNTHDGDPYMTEEEEKEWEDGGDPCLHVIKLIDK
jgi:hypothetical protein